MYSNKQSLIDTFGEKDVMACLANKAGVEDPNRLEKARSMAAAVIDSKLRAGGYLLPLLFTPYGATPLPGGAPLLNALVQNASDCLAMYYLALSNTLMKKEFADCYAEQNAWLNNLKVGKDSVDLPKTLTPTGKGDMVVLARPSILRNSDGSYNGCCGKRHYN